MLLYCDLHTLVQRKEYTLPAPITQLSPIVTPGTTMTLPPIHTLWLTVMGFAYSSPAFR